MATLLTDDRGIPIPQYADEDGNFHGLMGAEGRMYVTGPELASMLADTSVIKADVANIKTTLATMNTDLTAVKSDVNTLRTDVATINSALVTLIGVLNNIAADVNAIRNNMQTQGE